MKEMMSESLVPEDEQPYEIPDNWKWSKLGDIGKYYNGRAFKPIEWTDNGLPIVRIQNLTGSSKVVNYYSGPTKYDYELDNEDFLISWSATLGAFIWNGGKAVLNQHIFKVESKINKMYHYYLTKSIINELYKVTHGSGMVHVTKKVFDEIKVPLPPLPEQKRIVNKLESMLVKINESRELIEQARETFKTRKSSILATALSGNLTAEWRKNLGIQKNWQIKTLSEIVKFYGGGTPSKSVESYWKNGDIYWSSVKDIKEDKLFLAQDKITREGLYNSSATLAKSGDLILITRISPGKSCISMIETAINQDLKVVKPINDNININFLQLFFQLNKKNIEEQSQGTTVKGITIDKLNIIEILLPTLEEQKEIVRVVEHLLSLEDQAKELIDNMEEKLNLLEKSILSKAFRGELGTNNPDEINDFLNPIQEVKNKQLELI